MFIEFGVHLAELTVDPQGALAIRQVSVTKTFVGEGSVSSPHTHTHACDSYSDIIDHDQLLLNSTVLSCCLFAASICHTEAVCGDSLVFSVREVQAS